MSKNESIEIGTTAVAVVPAESSPIPAGGDANGGVVASTPLSLTLYDTEALLSAFTEGDGSDGLTDEERAVFRQIADAAARDKRDAVARFIRTLEAHVAAIKAEQAYLAGKRKAAERAICRIEEYVLSLIEQFAPEPKGRVKSKRFEGNVFKLCAESNSMASLVVTDPESLSDDFKDATVKMPLPMWNVLSEWLSDEDRPMVTVEITVDNKAVRNAIEAGAEYDGAKLVHGKHLKVR